MKIVAHIADGGHSIGSYMRRIISNGSRYFLSELIAPAFSTLHDKSSDISINLVINGGATCTIIDDITDEMHRALHDIKVELYADASCDVTYEWNITSSQRNIEKIKRVIALCCVGKGSKVSLQSALDTADSQSVTLHYAQIHTASHTTSDSLVRGVAQSSSHVEVQAHTRIGANIEQVQADQMHKHLVLDEGTNVVSEPNLEVESNDVSCSHGSSIRHIDEEHLFYLKSRGYDDAQARKALVTAFLAPVIS